MINPENLKVDPRIEGLLDKEGKRFNGVVFLMREPNTDGGKPNSFWFRKCLPPDAAVSKDYKGNFSTYKNKFIRLLSYVFPDKSQAERTDELRRCAYFNLRPDGGTARMSEEYKTLRDDPNDCRFRFEQILAYCKESTHADHGGGTLNIFTCQDIANALQEILQKRITTKSDVAGVSFKHGEVTSQRDCVQYNINGTDVRIYAIDHPAYSSHVCEKGE